MPADAAVPTLRVFLFGHPRIEWDDKPLKFSAPPKTLPLLAYIILHRASPLTRDSIAFTLWQDETEEDARANLRRHLYHLQRALPAADQAPWIVVGSDSLQWNPDGAAWVDVLAFARLVTQTETLEQAVDLYAGDLLESYYDDWVFADRERLRNEYLNALYALTVDHRSRRLWPSAVRHVRAILQTDPWREDAVRQLMSVQYDSGDRAGALQTYADFQRKLRAEMAVDAMPETTALHDLIVRNAPLTDVVPPGSPDAPARGQSLPALPFVGRQAAMEQLRTLWNRAARGSPALAFIEGEAGIGKSRLAAELALRVESEGGRVLWGPTSFPESVPYQGLAEALRQALPLITALTIDPNALSAVAALVPELRAKRPDLPVLAAANPDDERRRLLAGIAETLAALARSRPLLLIIEDVHWAGEATLAALRYLGSITSPIALLLVTTNREEEVPRGHALRALQRDLTSLGVAVRIAPARLQAYDIEKLVAQFPQLANTAGLAAALHARSEGNCLFLAQMIGDIIEAPPGRDTATSESAEMRLPGGLRSVIDARLGRISEDARSLAEVCAVIGRGFNVELVCEVSGWSKDKVYEAFDELLDRRLIRELPKRGSFEYSFAHHLIQDAVYALIPRDALVARHRRTGRVLADASQAGELAAEIARHFDLGEDRAAAGRFYLDAARYALSLFADSEALAHLARALELAGQDDRLAAEALLAQEAIQNRQGAREHQARSLERLDAIADRLDDLELQSQVLWRRIARERAMGNRVEEARLIDRLAARASERGASTWSARARLARALHAMHMGQLEPARENAELALAALERAGDPESEVECLCLLVDLDTQMGEIARAEDVLRRAQQAARSGAYPALVGRAHLAVARSAIMQHQFDRCAQACDEALLLFRSVGDREGEADALARRGSVLARLQRYEEARRENEAAAAIYESIGKDEGRAGELINGASLDTRLGLLDEAENKLLAADRIFERLGELRGLTVCALNLSFVYLVRRDLERAGSFARRGLELANKLQHKAFTAQALANLGAVERDRGQHDSALEFMQQGLALQETLSRPADLVNDLSDMALAYLMKGDFENARLTADRMLAGAEQSTDASFWPQGLFWTAALVYRACGKKKRASEFLGKARDYAHKLENVVDDPAIRERYNQLPVNLMILNASEKGDWPALAGRP
ncbi:MAG TPA: AAA family ATPase [Candidatus Acidoferrales bacterium]|nr:AAA family ATPase [Candidatus Acidoferrales bacterium]